MLSELLRIKKEIQSRRGADREVLKKVVGVFVLTLAIRSVMSSTSFSYVLLRLTW